MNLLQLRAWNPLAWGAAHPGQRVAEGSRRKVGVVRLALKTPYALAAIAGSLLCLPPAQGGVVLREPDCSVWLATRGSDTKDWILGYLSGMSLVWIAEHKAPAEPLTALSSRDEVFSWMDDYCRANPQQSLGRGAIVLFFELVKRKEGR